MTTKDEIRDWLKRSEPTDTHMLMVCDTFNYEDYPVYVHKGESVKVKEDEFNKKSMQKVMEVYSLKQDIESQLNEYRSFHYD
jgi:hypothetical protein